MKKQRFIANPLYDSVFKFLMEDEIVARTLLSALLKKEIVSVEMRPNEYSNREDGRVSIFRIDFGAIVREENGEEHLILIEVQKSWHSQNDQKISLIRKSPAARSSTLQKSLSV